MAISIGIASCTARPSAETSAPALAGNVEKLTYFNKTDRLPDVGLLCAQSCVGSAFREYYVNQTGRTVTAVNLSLSWNPKTDLNAKMRIQLYYSHMLSPTHRRGDEIISLKGVGPLGHQVENLTLALRDSDNLKIVVAPLQEKIGGVLTYYAALGQDFTVRLAYNHRPMSAAEASLAGEPYQASTTGF